MLMAEVIVKMKFCNKTHRITVKMKDDGDLSLHVATDCPEVKYYAECLGDTITMEDITDISSSRIMSPENLAWLETGMMSKKLAKDVKENVISFERVDDD